MTTVNAGNRISSCSSSSSGIGITMASGLGCGRFLVKALYDNVPDDDDELTFYRGDILTVLETDYQGLDGWWLCLSTDGLSHGLAPSNRLRCLSNNNESQLLDTGVSSATSNDSSSDYDIPHAMSSRDDVKPFTPRIHTSDDYDTPTPLSKSRSGSDKMANRPLPELPPSTSTDVAAGAGGPRQQRSSRRELPRPERSLASSLRTQSPAAAGSRNASANRDSVLEDYDIPRAHHSTKSQQMAPVKSSSPVSHDARKDVTSPKPAVASPGGDEDRAQFVTSQLDVHNTVVQIKANVTRWQHQSLCRNTAKTGTLLSTLQTVCTSLRRKLLDVLKLYDKIMSICRTSGADRSPVNEVAGDLQDPAVNTIVELLRLSADQLETVTSRFRQLQHDRLQLNELLSRLGSISDNVDENIRKLLSLTSSGYQNIVSTSFDVTKCASDQNFRRSLPTTDTESSDYDVPRSPTAPKYSRSLPSRAKLLRHPNSPDPVQLSPPPLTFIEENVKRMAVVVDREEGHAFHLLERRLPLNSSKLTPSKLVVSKSHSDLPAAIDSSSVDYDYPVPASQRNKVSWLQEHLNVPAGPGTSLASSLPNISPSLQTHEPRHNFVRPETYEKLQDVLANLAKVCDSGELEKLSESDGEQLALRLTPFVRSALTAAYSVIYVCDFIGRRSQAQSKNASKSFASLTVRLDGCVKQLVERWHQIGTSRDYVALRTDAERCIETAVKVADIINLAGDDVVERIHQS